MPRRQDNVTVDGERHRLAGECSGMEHSPPQRRGDVRRRAPARMRRVDSRPDSGRAHRSIKRGYEDESSHRLRGRPAEVTTVELEGPHAGEVMVEIKASGVCHTDEFTRSGADPEGLFPVIFGHEAAGVVVDV